MTQQLMGEKKESHLEMNSWNTYCGLRTQRLVRREVGTRTHFSRLPAPPSHHPALGGGEGSHPAVNSPSYEVPPNLS